METFKTVRWIRIFLSALFILIAIAAVNYWHTQNTEYCAVRYSPNGDAEIIFIGDSRCPD